MGAATCCTARFVPLSPRALVPKAMRIEYWRVAVAVASSPWFPVHSHKPWKTKAAETQSKESWWAQSIGWGRD